MPRFGLCQRSSASTPMQWPPDRLAAGSAARIRAFFDGAGTFLLSMIARALMLACIAGSKSAAYCARRLGLVHRHVGAFQQFLDPVSWPRNKAMPIGVLRSSCLPSW